jgi:hypothetical protein
LILVLDLWYVKYIITLIKMKVSVVISGTDMHRFGATSGVRTKEEIQQDIEDVADLILICKLERNLPLGNDKVQRRYEEIFDNRRP